MAKLTPDEMTQARRLGWLPVRADGGEAPPAPAVEQGSPSEYDWYARVNLNHMFAVLADAITDHKFGHPQRAARVIGLLGKGSVTIGTYAEVYGARAARKRWP